MLMGNSTSANSICYWINFTDKSFRSTIIGTVPITWPDGSVSYHTEIGELHMTDGPARCVPGRTPEWYLKGKQYSSAAEFGKDAGWSKEYTTFFILQNGTNL